MAYIWQPDNWTPTTWVPGNWYPNTYVPTEGTWSWKAIVSSFYEYVRANYSHSDVDWPGLDFDSTDRTTWIRPRIVSSPIPAQRQGDERYELNIEVSCIAKYANVSMYAVERCADAVQVLLENQAIQVWDYSIADGVPVGWLRVQQGQVGVGDSIAGADVRGRRVRYRAVAEKV